jgi:hypothetical protein
MGQITEGVKSGQDAASHVAAWRTDKTCAQLDVSDANGKAWPKRNQ